MPGWLQIDSPDELEGSLISVTVVVLAVHFLGVVVSPQRQFDTLQYGAGIALPIPLAIRVPTFANRTIKRGVFT